MEHNNSFFVSSVKTVTILRYVILPDSIPLDTLLVDDAKRLPKVGGKLPGIEEVDPISQTLCAIFFRRCLHDNFIFNFDDYDITSMMKLVQLLSNR